MTQIDDLPSPVLAGGDGREKLAQQVARRIERDIAQAGWPIGEVFGSEAELRQRYGVSRAVLREAIRLVEHHDVVITRRGPAGGVIVKAPAVAPVITSVAIYLEFVGASVKDLLQVRLLLEPLAARLAADDLSEHGLEVLRKTLEAERANGFDATKRDLLHVTVGELSGNPALHLFVGALSQLTSDYARQPRLKSKAAVAELAGASDDAHGAIVEAIVAGEVGLAEHRTVRHLEAMQEWLLTTRQLPIRRASRLHRLQDPGKAKRAEVLAQEILAEISYRRLGIGDVLGAEPELLTLFQVSRAVFREAVRLLEYHSVVRMRRGPGGGLVITRPDRRACIETIATYLDFRKIDGSRLGQVRDALELGALAAVVGRREDPEVRARLVRRLEPEAGGIEGDLDTLAHGLHDDLAELSGNPVLSLFLGILTNLTARHCTLTAEDRPDSAARTVAHIHNRIIEAVLDGDLALAQHRMRRHLEAVTDWWR